VGSVSPQVDVGLRQYMLHVYNYMAGGLALTGIVAYMAATSGLYQGDFRHAALLGCAPGAAGPVLFPEFSYREDDLGTAQLSFWAYAGLVGLSLAVSSSSIPARASPGVLHHRRHPLAR